MNKTHPVVKQLYPRWEWIDNGRLRHRKYHFQPIMSVLGAPCQNHHSEYLIDALLNSLLAGVHHVRVESFQAGDWEVLYKHLFKEIIAVI